MPIQPNPRVLEWAVRRSGLSKEAIVSAWPKYEQWLDGTWSPTIKQIRDFADKVHVNVPVLFSDTLPDLGLQIADFRTADDFGMGDPSPELYDTIGQMMRRQDWMREYFVHDRSPKIELVGSCAEKPMTEDAAGEVAGQFHEALCLEDDWAVSCKTVGDAFKLLKDRVESLGISVVVNGVVNDNTHRPLDVDEFRGFVLSDDLAPIIFINGRDFKSAQMFTLVHELCHLAYSQTGVSSPTEEPIGGENEVEHFCNRVAADFLAPTDLLQRELGDPATITFEKIDKLARKLKINFVVAARKAKDTGLISEGRFYDLYNQYKKKLPEKGKRGSGGSYYLNKQYRLGNVFSDAIWAAVNSDFVSYRDAYNLTGMGASSFNSYFMEAL